MSWTYLQILGFEWAFFILFFVVLAVVVFVLVGVWLYRDANGRGMDGTLWAVILVLASLFGSFIGGIIVLVVYLVVREGHPLGAARFPYGYPPAAGYGYSPYGYPFYGYPGAGSSPYAPSPSGVPPSVAPAAVPAATPPTAPSAAGRCSRCGAPIQPEARFCASCGSPL